MHSLITSFVKAAKKNSVKLGTRCIGTLKKSQGWVVFFSRQALKVDLFSFFFSFREEGETGTHLPRAGPSGNGPGTRSQNGSGSIASVIGRGRRATAGPLVGTDLRLPPTVQRYKKTDRFPCAPITLAPTAVMVTAITPSRNEFFSSCPEFLPSFHECYRIAISWFRSFAFLFLGRRGGGLQALPVLILNSDCLPSLPSLWMCFHHFETFGIDERDFFVQGTVIRVKPITFSIYSVYFFFIMNLELLSYFLLLSSTLKRRKEHVSNWNRVKAKGKNIRSKNYENFVLFLF